MPGRLMVGHATLNRTILVKIQAGQPELLGSLYNISMLVPKYFTPPELRKEKYIARELCASDMELDYAAVMSSIDIIHELRGGNWPTFDLTKEDDLIDLSLASERVRIQNILRFYNYES